MELSSGRCRLYVEALLVCPNVDTKALEHLLAQQLRRSEVQPNQRISEARIRLAIWQKTCISQRKDQH